MSNKSNDKRPAWLRTEEEVVEWFAEEPRTWGWQVLLALDRVKTNQLLQQEYIERYAKKLHFDPITSVVQTSTGGTQIWEHLYDHVLGPPLLSFENSRTDEWARLTMPVLGGIRLVVVQQDVKPKQVHSIDWYDPLTSPRVICEILLEETEAEVDHENRVRLDLRKGTRFRVTYSYLAAEQEDGGFLYESIFKNLHDDRKWFQIGQFSEFDEGAVLQPDKLRIRALSAQPARNAGEEGSKEGALLIFVGTKGNDVGYLPDKGEKWVYPIPEGHTSTLAIANKLVYIGLLEEGIQDTGLLVPDYTVLSNNNVYYGIDFHGGKKELHTYEVDIDGIPHKLDIFGNLIISPFDEDSKFQIRTVGEEVHMSWVVPEAPEGEEQVNYHWARIRPSDDPHSHEGAGAWVRSGSESRYHFVMNADGAVELKLVDSETAWAEVEPYNVSESYAPHLPAIIEKIKSHVETKLIELQRDIAGGIKEIEIFALYGVLFSGSQVVEQKSVRMPCDVVVFGEISPSRTTYKVTPVEANVGAGDTLKLETTPAQSGLTWDLEEVPGFPFPLGSITTAGEYTAPTKAQLPVGQAYTMVRATATKAGFTSAALLRVVVRDVVVNPMVTVASTVGGKVMFTGGALAPGALSWEVMSATGATLTDEPPTQDVGDLEEGAMYYVPGTGASGAPWSLDTITVTDSANNEGTSHVFLVENGNWLAGVIPEDPSLPEGKIQLGIYKSKDETMPVDECTWEVVVGGGTVDAKGVYTLPDASETPYAVVVGTWLEMFYAYLIVPLPLVDIGKMMRALR